MTETTHLPEPVLRHVMIDIETLGKGHHAAIASVGACYFDPYSDQLGENFYQHVEFSPSMGTLDPDTVKWWLSQSPEAIQSLMAAERKPLEVVLSALRVFLKNGEEIDGIWSNGPTFDEMILRDGYDRLGKRWPCSFRATRDCRTVYDIGRKLQVQMVERQGVHHDALSDAQHQARGIQACYKKIFGT